MTDRTQGGSSLEDGSIELMVWASIHSIDGVTSVSHNNASISCVFAEKT